MDRYFPNSGWLRVGRDTLDALTRFKADRGPADLGRDLRAAAQGSRRGRVTVTRRRPSTARDRFAAARAVADAVLYEGYVLYPYRASARKNQLRWQFGVLVPPAVRRGRRLGAVGDAHRVRGRSRRRRPRAHVRVRFLQVQHRTVEAVDRRRLRAGRRRSTSTAARWVPWDEAVEHEIDLDRCRSSPVAGAPSRCRSPRRRRRRRDRSPTDGRLVGRAVRRRERGRRRRPGRRRLGRRRPGRCVKVTVDGREHVTGWSRRRCRPRRGAAPARSSACTRCSRSTTARSSRCSTRRRARARPRRGCAQRGHLPGARRRPGRRDRRGAVVADHPLRPPGGGAREPGRPLRRHRDRRDPRPAGAHPHRRGEGRGPRAPTPARPRSSTAATTCRPRSGRACTARSAIAARRRRPGAPPAPSRAPWWDPGVDAEVDPWTDTIVHRRRRGRPRARTVRLRPSRRADAHDLFLAGMAATVAGVFHDVDGAEHVAVTLDDDPATEVLDVAGPLPLLPPRRDRGAGRVPTRPMTVLVAGIGNIFFGDDGFGVEVVDRLLRRAGCPTGSRSPTTASAACTSPTSCSTATTSSSSSTPCRRGGAGHRHAPGDRRRPGG